MGEEKQKHILSFRFPVRWTMWLLLSAALFGLMLFFFFYYPHREIGPKQPVPFSHRIHAGVKRINCLFCHSFAAESQRAGLPVMKKCFFCHDYIIPLHPEIEKERRHVLTREPLRWVRIFYLPDFTKFRHQPHIEFAGLDCVACHGPVQKMDRLQEHRFQMGFCIKCHRAMGAQIACWLSCHR